MVSVRSCENYALSSRRAALLRQSSAINKSADDRSPVCSAFTVHCSCTKQSRVATDACFFFGLPVAEAQLLFTRWRYWSLAIYRQFVEAIILLFSFNNDDDNGNNNDNDRRLGLTAVADQPEYNLQNVMKVQ